MGAVPSAQTSWVPLQRSAGTVRTRGHWLPSEISGEWGEGVGLQEPGVGVTWEEAPLGSCPHKPVSSAGQRPWTVTGGQPAGQPCSLSPSLGALSASDLREHAGAPLAPPTKRHCRSLSEPDELSRCRSPWRPGGSKVWTPVSKRRCHSGGSSTLQGSPVPRPSSASSSFPDGGCVEGDPAGRPAGPWVLSSRRRLSLSQEHLSGPWPSAGSTPSSTPELGRPLGLLRSRSQPCALNGRKSRRKRRREEEARGPRPSLDFLKMTRVGELGLWG